MYICKTLFAGVHDERQNIKIFRNIFILILSGVTRVQLPIQFFQLIRILNK